MPLTVPSYPDPLSDEPTSAVAAVTRVAVDELGVGKFDVTVYRSQSTGRPIDKFTVQFGGPIAFTPRPSFEDWQAGIGLDWVPGTASATMPAYSQVEAEALATPGLGAFAAIVRAIEPHLVQHERLQGATVTPSLS